MAAVSSEKKELFESTPIPKALASMAIPIIISQLINLIYNVADAFFIGRAGNSYMMASTTLALPLVMMTVAIANLYGVGAGSQIARLIGANRPDEAKRACSYGFYGALLVSFVYSAAVGIFMRPILTVLGGSEATIGFASQYVFFVIILGTIPNVMSSTIANFLMNVGFSKQASAGFAIGAILNIFLDPLFMFVLLPEGYEVLGAAAATFLSNAVAMGYQLYNFRKAAKASPLGLDFRDALNAQKESINVIYTVGVPSAMLTVLYDIANIFLNMLAASHGDLVLAALGIAMKAERLPVAINLGISRGMMPIVSYNFASGNIKRMKEAINTARIWGITASLCCVAMYTIFAEPITRFFLSTSSGDAETALITIGLAAGYLKLRCLASPVHYINYQTSFCLQAIGDGKSTTIHAVCRQVFFYIPFIFILNYFFGPSGIAFSLAAGEACSAVLALFLLRRSMAKNGL